MVRDAILKILEKHIVDLNSQAFLDDAAEELTKHAYSFAGPTVPKWSA